MKPFSLHGAKHFCQAFSGPSSPPISVRDLFNSVLKKKKSFKEGEAVFQAYRNSLLREADRSLFLSISCFRRSLDLFSGASVFWAHVTLYYSSWFAAHSVLAMHGCWVEGKGKVIQVKSHSPGSQEFEVEKNYSTQYTGSHQIFWDAYYKAMNDLVLWTDPSLQLAVKPVSNSNTWAIDKRNLVNYQTTQAFDLMDEFVNKFDAKKFPGSLQGDVATQFQLSKTLLLFCANKATDFGLKTDVHSSFSTRKEAIEKLIFKNKPALLTTHSEEAQFTI